MNEGNSEVKIELKPPVGEGKKRRGRKPAFKPTQFDLDLLHLLREGTGAVDELVDKLGVAKIELLQRIDLLKAEHLVTEENNVFHLSVNGYNFYTSKAVKKVSLKKAFTGEVKLQKHKVEKKHEKEDVEPEKQKHVNEWLSSTEVVDLGGKLGKMDLQEIIQRYGPTQEQRDKYLQRKATESTFQRTEFKATKPIAAGAQIANSEACDLCKSGFKLAVSDAALAKYGHCFCGAAYHKECYDSLLTDSGHCVRCGKKLFLIIDKQSREVINKIKDMFE